MAKDAYWFSHDSNTMDDPKIMLLMSELGLEGYGIYWTLIEHLRNQPGYISNIRILKALAIRYNTSEEKYKTVVKNYELFLIKEDGTFLSESLCRRMYAMDLKRKKLQRAAKKGNAIRWGSGGDHKQIANKVNKNKVKENKTDNKIYKSFVEKYFDFFKKLNDNIEPQMNAIEGKNLKQIINYFRKIYKGKISAGEIIEISEDESILKMWEYVLGNWGKLDNFYLTKTRIRDINSNLQNIITQLKHGRDSKHKTSDADIDAIVGTFFK